MKRILGGSLALVMICLPPQICIWIAVNAWMDGEVADGLIALSVALLPIVNIIFVALHFSP
jgi:hypothetical protein